MHMLLALFGALSESARLAIIGSGLILVAVLLRKIMLRNPVSLASSPKFELPSK